MLYMVLCMANGVRASIGIGFLSLIVYVIVWFRNGPLGDNVELAWGGVTFVICAVGLGLSIGMLPRCESFKNSKKKRKNN